MSKTNEKCSATGLSDSKFKESGHTFNPSDTY